MANKVVILPVYKQIKEYINEVRKGEKEADILWDEIMVSPYWDKLCEYAPMDLSMRKPEAITNLSVLEEQYKRLCLLDIEKLTEKFNQVTKLLPNYDDDPITVAIYPFSDSKKEVREKQNGVIGTSLFGNLYISVNPLATEYEKWIPYVFAHEYHHTVWGNFWYCLHGKELKGTFIDSLVIDGLADTFAMSLYPECKPLWIFSLEEDELLSLWYDTYRGLVNKQEVDYATYMFGSKEEHIPWCAGYAIGYAIVQHYLKQGKQYSNRELIETNPVKFLE